MYGGKQQYSWDFRAIFSRGSTPVTFSVIALAIVGFVFAFAAPSAARIFPLAFSAQNILHTPWTLLTWPFARDASGPFGLLFAAWWFYMPSASMERAWGKRDYGLFLVATGLLTTATLWMSRLLGGPGILGGLWIFAAPTTIAWYVANRRETINLFFLPLPAVVLPALSVVLAWYYAGAAQGNSFLGFFALSGSAAAYWYATKGRYASGYGYARPAPPAKPFGGLRVTTGSSAPRQGDRERVTPAQSPWQNPLAWLQARLRRRKEDKQFEDILRRSGFSDPDDKNPRR